MKTKSLTLYVLHVPFALVFVAVAVFGGSYLALQDSFSLPNNPIIKEGSATNVLPAKTNSSHEIVITQEELNELIEQNVVGRGYGDLKVKSAVVELKQNILDIDGKFINGTGFYVKLVVLDDQKSLEVVDLDVEGRGLLTGYKKILLKAFVNDALDRALLQYEGKYESISVSPKELIIRLTDQ